MIKILIAEDEVRSRTALASRLREILGEQSLIETACDGNEAILKARQVEPQLILMDIEMPHKNGLEAAAVIKQQLPQTHIVFLTAYDRFDYAVGAMRSGGEDYLLKPPADAELRELVQKFFKVSPEASRGASSFERDPGGSRGEHGNEPVLFFQAGEIRHRENLSGVLYPLPHRDGQKVPALHGDACQ